MISITAESRDTKLLKKKKNLLISSIVLYAFVLLISLVVAGINGGLWWIPCIVLAVAAVPLLVFVLIKANEVYNTTWRTDDYVLDLRDNHLYLGDVKLTVNQSANYIYLHDFKRVGNSYKASVYLTVFGDSREQLKAFIDDNGVKVEKEKTPRIAGKYGYAASAILAKYRRA